MLIASDPRNSEVVRPYLVGEDLNTRPDTSPSRWVIDFREWPLDQAREYPAPLDRLQRLVRPERAKANRAAVRDRWWQFEHWRRDLYRAIGPLDRCIAITLHSKSVQMAFVPTGQVFSHALAVFALDDVAHFGLLSSGFHWWWAVSHASTMRMDIRYTPTDCFETFAQPELTTAIGIVGDGLAEQRTALMLARQEGLTQTYNRFHDAGEHADDIVGLRNLHATLDYAVRGAYGWSDLDLGHDFHQTKFGTRYTFAPRPRQEVLDRLLELNHARYAEEVAQGLHSKAKSKPKPSAARAQNLSLFGD